MCFWIAAVSLHLSLNESKLYLCVVHFITLQKQTYVYSRLKFCWQVSDKRFVQKQERRPIYHNQYIILGRRQMYTRQIIIINLRTTSLTNWKDAVV